MTRSYPNAAAFRQALEARLRNIAQERGVQIQGLRLKVAIERLLARLFDRDDPPWLLKGGYAMELRFRPRARTTRDVDLTIGDPVQPARLRRRLDEVHEELQSAAGRDLGDYFEFIIQPARSELQVAPGGGGVFPVVVAGYRTMASIVRADRGLGKQKRRQCSARFTPRSGLPRRMDT